MSITEVALISSLIVNLFTITLVFLMFLNMLNIKHQVQQIHIGMSTTISKIFAIEQLIAKMANGFTELIDMTGNMVDGSYNKILYKTADGRYTGSTVDELISNIKKDGELDEYFTDDELDKLKKLFETDDTFDEDED